MGLDQSIYLIRDLKKYKKVKNKLNKTSTESVDVRDELNKKFEKIFIYKFVDNYIKDYKKIEEKYSQFVEANLKDNKEEISLKFRLSINDILNKTEEEIKEEKDRFNKVLFNFFPMIMIYSSIENEEMEKKFKKEVTDLFLKYLFNILNYLKKDKPDILELFKKVSKYNKKYLKLSKKSGDLLEEKIWWSKDYHIHGWFLKNVKFEDQKGLVPFSYKKIEKLISDIKLTIFLIENYIKENGLEESFEIPKNTGAFERIRDLFWIKKMNKMFYTEIKVNEIFLISMEESLRALSILDPKDSYLYMAG